MYCHLVLANPQAALGSTHALEFRFSGLGPRSGRGRSSGPDLGSTTRYLHGGVFVVGRRAGGQLDGSDAEAPDVCLEVVAANLRGGGGTPQCCRRVRVRTLRYSVELHYRDTHYRDIHYRDTYLLHDLGGHPTGGPHEGLPHLVPGHVAPCC